MAVNERYHPGIGLIIANVTLAGGVILGTTLIANEFRKSTLSALSVEGGQDPGVLPTSRVNKTATRTPEPTLIPHTPTSIPATVEEAGGYNFTKTPEASATLETPTMSPEEKAVLDMGYEIKDGKAYDENGILIFNGRISQEFAIEVAKKDCQKTDFVKAPGINMPTKEYRNEFLTYTGKQYDKFLEFIYGDKIPKTLDGEVDWSKISMEMEYIAIPGKDNCWAGKASNIPQGGSMFLWVRKNGNYQVLRLIK